MSVTKVINIEVRDAELQGLEKDLNKVGRQFDKVDSEAKKASTSIKDVGDNGGAIALLDELTGGLATKIRDAAEASKLFNFSLKGTRTALIATGIGAFVVAVGTLVAYWSDIKDFITGSNTELQKQIDLQQEILVSAERELQTLDKQDNILKLQGKTQSEINKQKKEALKIVIQEAEEQLRLAQQRLKELEAIKKAGGSGLESFLRGTQVILNSVLKTVDEFFKKIGFNTDFAGTQFSVSESLLESIFGTQEDIDEADARVKALEDKILDARNRLAGISLSEINNNVSNGQRQQIQSIVDPASSTEIQNAQIIADAKLEIVKNSAEQELAVEQYLNDQKIAITKQTLGAISNILGQNTAAGKAFGIAQALINTYQGITQVLKSESTLPEPLATASKIANVATVLATGLQAVRQIKQVQVPGFSGAQGAAVSQGAPSFNVVGNSGVSQLAQTLQEDQNPVQAFVVSTAVTSQQELDNQIQQTATIG